jgi:hypothetical protein
MASATLPVQRYCQVRRMSPGPPRTSSPAYWLCRYIEDPMWRGWAPRKRQDGQSSLRASGKTVWEDFVGSIGAACRYLRVHNFSQWERLNTSTMSKRANREAEEVDVEKDDEREVPDLRRSCRALYFGQRDLRAARVVAQEAAEGLALPVRARGSTLRFHCVNQHADFCP